ncbi:MAG: FAD-dependent oxidoreductase [Candidatus Pacearchaeota archaeon]
MHDLAIVGGGIAGLTAAIFAKRKQLDVIIITPEIGGQTNITESIENYPGFGAIKGSELIKKILDKVAELGTEFLFAEVINIERKNQFFILKLNNGKKVEAKAVILAFGKTPAKLGVGEEKFLGRGVSICVTCDAPLYKNKIVAVVGGGNSAVDAALELSQIAKKVYLIHRRESFRADELSLKKLKEKKNVIILTNSIIIKFQGKEKVESIVIENTQSKKQQELNVDGVFLELGFVMASDWLKGFVELDSKGQIVIDSLCQTSREGVFAAGDCTNTEFKQAVISAGQGAIAALQAYQYLSKGEGAKLDWKKL